MHEWLGQGLGTCSKEVAVPAGIEEEECECAEECCKVAIGIEKFSKDLGSIPSEPQPDQPINLPSGVSNEHLRRALGYDEDDEHSNINFDLYQRICDYCNHINYVHSVPLIDAYIPRSQIENPNSAEGKMGSYLPLSSIYSESNGKINLLKLCPATDSKSADKNKVKKGRKEGRENGGKL